MTHTDSSPKGVVGAYTTERFFKDSKKRCLIQPLPLLLFMFKIAHTSILVRINPATAAAVISVMQTLCATLH